jgi:hypothetical protein
MRVSRWCVESNGVSNEYVFTPTNLELKDENLTQLGNGAVAIVLQDESYNINLAVSYDSSKSLR